MSVGPVGNITAEVIRMFEDRADAGRRLAEAMRSYAYLPEALVLGVPRGGVSVAAEVARRMRAYRGDRPPLLVSKRTAILVDDGIATGLTVRAAVGYLRHHGAKRIVVAAPIMPPETAAALSVVADEIVALETPRVFSAVGQFYRDFSQTSDAELVALLGGMR